MPDGARHGGEPPAAFEARSLAEGPGWRADECVCRRGPHDRRFEEQHRRVSIAAVIAGTFQYRTDAGRALLYPGAFMLGNAGTAFECGHDHGTGDRCIAFHFEPALFEEIAASMAGTLRFRFAAAALPALPPLAPAMVEAESRSGAGDPAALEDTALRLAEHILAAASGHAAATAAPSARDERRITAALRHAEAAADGPLDLDSLAAAAAMSKYHFLRCFRRLVGATPYQYLLGLRLRRAALRLRRTNDAVSAIAFDAGFGDLSTFNARFRTTFGVSPSGYRKRSAGNA
ncbi:MAG: helix-turn-helix transcriptional regulator [Rhodospirillaceae bacterium]|nr:helix-turn-helix transcriptional regulator [Rhodospirillaceae bacterium]